MDFNVIIVIYIAENIVTWDWMATSWEYIITNSLLTDDNGLTFVEVFINREKHRGINFLNVSFGSFLVVEEWYVASPSK